MLEFISSPARGGGRTVPRFIYPWCRSIDTPGVCTTKTWKWQNVITLFSINYVVSLVAFFIVVMKI